MKRSTQSVLFAPFYGLLATVLLASNAGAQVDLPKKTKTDPPKQKLSDVSDLRSGRDTATLNCRVCFAENPEVAVDSEVERGRQLAYCKVCRRETLHQVFAVGERVREVFEPQGEQRSRKTGRGGTLDLPSRRVRRGDPLPTIPKAAREAAREAHREPTPEPAGSSPMGRTGAAGFVLEEVKRASRIDDPLVIQAANSLIALGAPGLEAARVAIVDVHPPTMITAARVLLRAGTPDDADRVVERVRHRMPGRVGAALVGELTVLDPVRATPALMAELLDHPQSPVRSAAQKVLIKWKGPELVVVLEPILNSERSDARLRAVDLLTGITDPRVLELLLDHIDDRTAKVAARAVDGVAVSTDPRTQFELLAIAFGERWILRRSAYALLAIIEREDRSLEPILGESHVEALLRGSTSSDPFIAGTCAAALAGIGFRSEDHLASEWLDKEVPERLVWTVMGQEFFDDHSSLQGSALRRLKQVAGISFGADGPAWARWWLDGADEFRASRAMIVVEDGQERELLVRFTAGDDRAAAFQLMGPDAKSMHVDDAAAEIIFLTEAEARDYVDFMRREGVLGSDRLPGVRGGDVQNARSLEVRVAGQAKGFVVGPGVSEPWFEHIVSMAESLRDRNRWQRFPHPEIHETRQALWAVEHDWWGAEHTDIERGERLKGLVIARLQAVGPADRLVAIAELERLYEDERLRDAADFASFEAVLSEEVYYTDRARRLARLAMQSAGLDTDAEPTEAARKAGWELVATLHDRFSDLAANEIAAVLSASGQATIHSAAGDRRSLLRAISATLVASGASVEDGPILLQLLADPDEGVQVAAVIAAGQHKFEPARTDVQMLARVGAPEVREAAFRSVGQLGGVGALTTLLGGLSDRTDRIRLASAEGLADLADPETAPLLVSYLRLGRESEIYGPVRRGILKLGEAAWSDLLIALRSASPKSQREAALLLAYQGIPDAVSTLLSVLTEDPTDTHVSNELAILTSQDFRADGDPAASWWHWWDSVRHDDSLAWFRAALESRGLPTPSEEDFEGGGTLDAITFLIATMGNGESFLAERARRVLGRLVERDLGKLPPNGRERDAWLGTLLEALTGSRE
jgi:HEAT repeat protein